jgi:glycosyltransferase involved in cell wall biosynthesis
MCDSIKVLHIVATPKMRGAERFALDLASTLAEMGQSQKICILKSTPHEELPPSPVPLVALPCGGGVLTRLLALRNLLFEVNPAVVVCHGLEPLKYVRLALLGTARPTLVVKKIGMTAPWLRRFRKLRLLISRWALSGVDMCVVLGREQEREVLELLSLPPKKVVRISNARSQPNLPTDVLREENLVLMVGALSEEKQPWIAIDVLRRLHEGGTRARLRFVGDGPVRSDLESKVESEGLSDFVSFAGHVGEVWKHYCQSSALLLCSRTEGVPGVLIEAAFCGVPVVAWDVGDVRAVVEHGTTGLVPPYGDVDALVESMRRVLTDHNMRVRLGQSAIEGAERFTMEAVASRYATLFRSLEEARGRA